MDINKILCGDSLEVLKDFEDNYFDSVVTDPPYGLAFMGKKWDYDVPEVDLWKEVYRVLKPGGHILSFAGSRTYHRMAVNIEDAGFEIRDMLGWLYGSGFPKSHNIGHKVEEYKGWGTALKPAHEPIVMARKPLSEKTVARNVMEHGTGGINIDGCRIDNITKKEKNWTPQRQSNNPNIDLGGMRAGQEQSMYNNEGRFPANIIHDGSEEVLEVFEESSRFFYCAKASKAERDMGLKDLVWEKQRFETKEVGHGNLGATMEKFDTKGKNNHPTVKPIKLMEYLVRLVTPKEGIVLEPFAGSGTTLIACKQQGFNYIGIEKEQEYCDIAEARLKAVQVQGELF